MLSLIAIVAAAIMAVLAIPPVNRAVSSVLPKALSTGLEAWGRLAPRFFAFIMRRTKRQLLNPRFVSGIMRYGAQLSGLNMKNINYSKFPLEPEY